MESESYNGSNTSGHAIRAHADILQPERYAGSGTITKSMRFAEASSVLGYFESDKDAHVAGLASARAWIDGHE
ncbi:hypothetical protein P0D88_38140 [Paraburkholderia sp. RL18-103-BIB-C]|uniref:hypothetical protein n=1 Tax=unclassified Paraburkholderia TaxID=2615204 RepID=UPI0038B7C7DD